MANSAAQNVIQCDTNDTTYAQALKIRSIRYIGNTNGTVTIKFENSSGVLAYVESGATNTCSSDLCIEAPKGVHVAITNGAKVYLYLD
jgi:hypothetical protein